MPLCVHTCVILFALTGAIVIGIFDNQDLIRVVKFWNTAATNLFHIHFQILRKCLHFWVALRQLHVDKPVCSPPQDPKSL
eukprot:m.10185 g.10185  ORF g.10185 m.10185 type:complete len:80 (+) comp6537_c0_seq2:590-829(+)